MIGTNRLSLVDVKRNTKATESFLIESESTKSPCGHRENEAFELESCHQDKGKPHFGTKYRKDWQGLKGPIGSLVASFPSKNAGAQHQDPLQHPNSPRRSRRQRVDNEFRASGRSW